MIRLAFLRAASRRATTAQRTLVTARQKRELDEAQLQGAKPTVQATPPGTASATATPQTVAAPGAPSIGTPGGSDGGGGGNTALILGGIAAIGLGAAVYMDVIPLPDAMKDAFATKETKPVDDKKAKIIEDAKAKPVIKENASKSANKEIPASDAAESASEAIKEVVSEVVEKVQEEVEKEVPDVLPPTGRVTQISLPTGSTKTASAPPPPPVVHPENGNRVAMNPSKPVDDGEVPLPSVVDRALKELQDDLSHQSSVALSEAHKELAKMQSSLDVSDLDNMTTTQLKVRLVQLAKDLEERTKWEAVRLKEFMAMKEKEVSEEYLQLLKSQRIELEHMMERRLREQNETLTQEKQIQLAKKEEALQSIVDQALEIQENQFKEEKEEYKKTITEMANAKFETFFGEKLAQVKAEYSNRMEQKLQQVEALSKKLSTVELALQSSEAFASGSVKAHRVSAAALALADRLQTSQPASDQVAAFKALSGYNAVLKAAAMTIPESVSKSGVPTLQELQTRFEDMVYPNCRQAAMVPKGLTGLEGQIVGAVVSTVKFPPAFGDAAPEGEQDSSEYVLTRARRHVQLGQLESAVKELEKLGGQAAIIANDFRRDASDRVAIDKALKVIRLECAMTNEAMSKPTAV